MGTFPAVGRGAALWQRNHLVLTRLERGLRQAIRCAALPSRACLLDLGCGRKPFASLFGEMALAAYFGLDVDVDWGSSCPGPDVQGDGGQLPFSDGHFDVVLCSQVLTYAPTPWHMVREAYRVLCVGGIFIASGHGLWPVLGDPDLATTNRWRWTQAGWHAMLTDAGFRKVRVTPAEGAAAAYGQFTCLFIDRVLPPVGPASAFARTALFGIVNVMSSGADAALSAAGGEFATCNYVVTGTKTPPD